MFALYIYFLKSYYVFLAKIVLMRIVSLWDSIQVEKISRFMEGAKKTILLTIVFNTTRYCLKMVFNTTILFKNDI